MPEGATIAEQIHYGPERIRSERKNRKMTTEKNKLGQNSEGPQLPASKLTRSQVKTYPATHSQSGAAKEYKEPGTGKIRWIKAQVRFDDQCGNGHNSFAITGSSGYRGKEADCFGCMHEEIAKHFPELAPFIKWHLVSTDGSMHYIANTLYHAGNRDHNGLLKGEFRQLRDRKTGLPAWKLQEPATKQIDAEEKPAPVTLEWEAWGTIGEGKERDLDAARSAAVWPDATDEQLCAEPEELKRMLLERLPALMVEFKAAVESLGFTY